MENKITLQGKEIKFSIQSVRRFLIQNEYKEFNITKNNNNEFVRLEFGDGLYSISKGDVISLWNSNKDHCVEFIVNNIIQKNDTDFEAIETVITKTGMFLLPFLGRNHLFFGYEYYLYNAYIGEEYDKLYLKYKFINDDEYLGLENSIESHPNFINRIDKDKKYSTFIFKINDEYLESVSLILDGKYSSIPESHKLNILSFHGLSSRSKIGKVLYNDIDYRIELSKELGYKIPNNIDLMSKPNLEDELWIFQDTLILPGIKN